MMLTFLDYKTTNYNTNMSNADVSAYLQKVIALKAVLKNIW
jgi:hypothetical protein